MNFLCAITANFRRLYCFLPAILTAVLAIGLAILSNISQPLNPKIIDTHVKILGLQSTRLQFLLYAFCAVIIVGSTILILATRKLNWPRGEQKAAPESGLSYWLLASLFILLGLCTSGNYKLPFFVSLAAVFPLRLIFGGNQKFVKYLKVAIVSSCVAYLAAAYLVPLIFEYPISGIDYLVSHETHHAVTVLPGVDIARGQKLETAGGYYYGFIMPIGVTITTWITGLTSSDPLITVRTVQLFNIFASILIVLLIYAQLPANSKWLTFVSLPLLPSLSLTHGSISHPNQAGIRYITLLIGLLVLTAVNQRQQYKSAWILGITGGLLMGINLELGVCINTGFAAYILINTISKKDNLVLQGVLYLGLAALAFVGTSWIAISSLTNNRDLSSLGYFVSMFGVSGYGGLVSVPSFLAMAAFYVAASVITAAAIRMTSKKVEDKNENPAFGCGIAMMIIAWLPYYVNRMSEWNLWIIPLLLLLIAIDQSKDLYGRLCIKTGLHSRLSTFVLMPIVLATTFVGSMESVTSTLNYIWKIKENKCEFVFRTKRGYCQSNDIKERINELNRFLDMPSTRRADYLLLSPFHDTSGRIKGFNKQFPWHATIGAITWEELRKQSEWINKKGPMFILIPNTQDSDSIDIKERIRHLRLIADGTKYYLQTSDQSGWRVYQRQK